MGWDHLTGDIAILKASSISPTNSRDEAIRSDRQILIGKTSENKMINATLRSPDNSVNFDFEEDGGVTYLNATVDESSKQTISISNIGFDYDSGTGVFSVTSADGSSLSTLNPGVITIWKRQATDPGKLVTIKITSNRSFIDDNGASEIAGNLFGTETGVSYTENLPFAVKVVLNDSEDNVAFCLSRNIDGKTSPSSSDIGTPSNAVADKQNDYWSFDDITTTAFDGNPAMTIGLIYMRKNASNDWTVQGLFASSSGLNVPLIEFADSNNFLSDTGSFGAATGSYLKDNGGTAPTFTNQNLRFQFASQFFFSWFSMSGNSATDGAGSVDAIIAMPYTAQATGGSRSIICGSGYVLSPAYTGIVIFEIEDNTLDLKMRDINGNYFANEDFSDGSRTIIGSVQYRTGGNP